MLLRLRSRAACGTLLALIVGCADGDVFLAIDVKTDLVPEVDFDRIAIVATRGGREVGRQELGAGDVAAAAFPRGTRVAEYGPVATGDYRIEAALVRAGREVMTREVRLTLRENTAVVVVMPTRCVGVSCPTPDHPDWTTCGDDGRCVDPRCSADTPRWCPVDDAGSADAGPRDAGPRDAFVPPVDTGPSCPVGAGCDDGDLCTHDDRCAMDGSCRGTAITCTGDACNARSCNGTAACTVTPMGGAACDDGNPCTINVCDDAGACLTAFINTDGSQPIPGDYLTRCCGNEVVNILADDRHCGGCWINCRGNGCADTGFGLGVCNCPVSDAWCRDQNGGPTWTCYDSPTDPFGWQCNCQSDADCSHLQHCDIVSGLNRCLY